MKKALFLAAILFLGVSTAHANFADTYGLGAKGASMGSAMTALADDWSSAYYNMAGLGRRPQMESLAEVKSASTQLLYRTLNKLQQKKVLNEQSDGTSTAEEPADKINNNELALGYLYTLPMMNVSYGGATETDALSGGALSLGMVIDMNTFMRLPYGINMRLGVGAILEGDFGLGKVTDDDVQTHYFLRYGRRIQRFLLNMGVGFEVWKDHLFLGVGSTTGVGGQGVVQINEVGLTEEPQTPPARTKMNLRPRQAPLAGISFKWDNLGPGNFNAGMTYRGELVLKIDPFATEATTELGNINMQMSLAIQDYFTPNEYVFGVAYTYPAIWIFRSVTMAIDLEYQQWSRYDLSRSQKLQSTYEDPNFSDIIIYRFGFEESVYPWLKIREGYVFRPAFTPDQTGRSNYLDNDTHIIALGAGFIIPDILVLKVPVEIDIAYQFQYLVPRESIKIDQSNPYNPNYTYDGMVHTVFFSIRWRY
ncbi:MAG: hypothetical protein KBA61_03735 [Spirochaetes bacterium]|nr:hypothetical protein [Spirochaetota bacterium]